MSFAENLQFLRKQKEITQEQMAEMLDVSRQSVSKWESAQSYPEMEKLLLICRLFHCNMDTLMQGDLSKAFAKDSYGYDRQKDRFSKWISAEIGIIILGVSAMLFLTGAGMSEEFASVIFFLMLIVAVMIIVVMGMQMERFRQKHPVIEDFYTEEEKDQAYRKFTVRVAVGVGIILVGLLLVMTGEAVLGEIDIATPSVWIRQSDHFINGLFLLLVAIGVTILVYAGLQKEKYNVENYNKEGNPSPERKKRNALTAKLCGCIMMLATCVYLFWSFMTANWEITWIVYPIAGIFCGIAAVALGGDGKSDDKG